MSVSNEYKEMVCSELEKSARLKRSLNVPFSDYEHGLFLTEVLIAEAKDNGKINIFSGSLRDSIYKEYGVLNALKDAKKRNVEIRIIFEEDLTKKEKKLCKEYDLKPLKLIKSTPEQENYKFVNFLVSDNIHFRADNIINYKKLYFNKDLLKTKINFNNKKEAKLYSDLFENSLLVNSERIGL